jgi:hypothetical protein
MRDTRLIGLRRHDPHIVGNRTRNLLADFQARRVDAVIIRDKDTHY